MLRPGIEPGTPGSVIERHNHKAKRSGPVRLVIYAPYIFTYILIICTSLCRATTHWQSMTWPWPRQKVKLRKGCVLLKDLTLKLVWSKYKSSILNTSAVTNTFQNLNTELEHGFKWQSMTWPWPRQVKLRLGCATERSNPKAGVGQILKLYLEYFSNYVHLCNWKVFP